MKLSLSRLRPVHLVGLTLLYWAGLLAVKLGRALAWAWDVSQLPQNHGAISASLTNTVLSLSIVREGVPVWTGSVSLPVLAAWIVGPPLLLALTVRWMRETDAAVDALGQPEAAGSLGAPPPEWQTRRRDAARPARTRPSADDRPADDRR